MSKGRNKPENVTRKLKVNEGTKDTLRLTS